MAGIDVVTLALAKGYADEHDGRAMDSETKAGLVQEVLSEITIPTTSEVKSAVLAEMPTTQDLVTAVIEAIPDGDNTEY